MPETTARPARPAREIAPDRLGERLRQARRVKGLRLRDLAERTGCTESFLSKVENGRTMPSLPLLHRIVLELETNIGWLFEDEDAGSDPVTVGRDGARPMIRLDPLRQGSGVMLERVIAYGTGHLLQCNIHHIAPGGGSDGPIEHAGEEIGFVLEGDVELTVGDRGYRLAAGDSFHFRSELPHAYRNAGPTPVRILWVNTPPTF